MSFSPFAFALLILLELASLLALLLVVTDFLRIMKARRMFFVALDCPDGGSRHSSHRFLLFTYLVFVLLTMVAGFFLFLYPPHIL